MASTESTIGGNFSDFVLEEEDLSVSQVTEVNWLRFISDSLSLAIYIIGLLVNILVCAMLASKVQLRTPLNLFLGMLSLNDVSRCICASMIVLTRLIVDHWVFGAFMCHLVIFHIILVIWFDFLIVSTVFVTFIFFKTPSIKASLIGIAVLFSVTLCIALKYGLDGISYEDHQGFQQCGRIPAYTDFIQILLRMTIPIVLISFYVWKMCFGKFSRIYVPESINRLLLMMIVTYAVNLLPSFTFIMLEHNFKIYFRREIQHFASVPVRTNVLIRPFLYFYFIEDFKQSLRDLWLAFVQRTSYREDLVTFSEIDLE